MLTTCNRFDLTVQNNNWEYIRKYLSCSLFSYNLKQLKMKIIDNTIKRSKIKNDNI